MSTDLIGKAAGLLAAMAFIPYVRGIFKGTTRPNRASWLIWSVLGICLFFTYLASGAKETIWIPLWFAIQSTVIFLISIKRGVGGYERLDIICLIGAAISLLLWQQTNNPRLALYLNVFIDALGFIPTVKKAYANPRSENKIAWFMGASACVINLFAVSSWRPEIYLYPVYLVIFNVTVAMLLTRSSR